MPPLSSFVQQQQSQELWCWAAVAVSVSSFFGRPPQFLQCTLVQRVTGLTGCCDDPRSCDQMNSLETALTTTTNLAGPATGPVPLSSIQQEIRHDKPVPIRIARRDGTAHVMTIVACEGEGPTCQLTIEDPFFGRDTITFETLRDREYRRGRWSHTYFTF